MKHIFIADDHPIFLKGLADTINDDPELEVTLAVKTGVELLAQLPAKVPDAIVLDLDMPYKNGIDTAVEVLKKHADLPVILLTAHKEKDLFIKALEVGIMGYVLKDNAAMDINNAIHHVMAGKAYISPEMSALLIKRNTVKPEVQHKISQLTPTELTVLQMVAAFKSSREIAEELFISEKTVSNHRMNITAKLQLSGKNSLLRFGIAELNKS